jgi:hypothetical protein
VEIFTSIHLDQDCRRRRNARNCWKLLGRSVVSQKKKKSLDFLLRFNLRSASRIRLTKKQINPAIKTHLIRCAIYLLLLLTVCVIPFAFGQRSTTNRIASANTRQLPSMSSDSDVSTASHALAMPKFPAVVLYDQYNNPATEPPLNIGSQKFEPAMAAFDDQAADDFVVTTGPPGFGMCITSVRVMGEYSEGGGPASAFNVYIYTNGAGNLPGVQIGGGLNLAYTGAPPDFTINLPSPFCRAQGIPYWLSVQAVQDFNPNGQWFWHNRTVQSNAGAAWQNPGNGYGTGCITWNRKNACLSDQVWPDQVFQILGFFEGNPPSPTPTATVTATATVTPTPTPIASASLTSTPTATPTATATATATQTSTPRPSPTPRPALTPRPRPTPPPRP